MADENHIWSVLLGLTGGNAFGTAGPVGDLTVTGTIHN